MDIFQMILRLFWNNLYTFAKYFLIMILPFSFDSSFALFIFIPVSPNDGSKIQGHPVRYGWGGCEFHAFSLSVLETNIRITRNPGGSNGDL